MITFSGPRETPYGCFHNFAGYPVTLYGMDFDSAEHAYQALKFYPDEAMMNEIRVALSPKAAAMAGRDPSRTIRSDWDQPPRSGYYPVQIDDGLDRKGFDPEPLFTRVKDVVMFEVCCAKFVRHEAIRETLFGTGDQPLIEDSSRDSYWGWGPARMGQNKLGRILMMIRNDFR